MAQLEKFIKVTQEQYNTLQAGGTVGGHTGINPNFIYLVEGGNDGGTTVTPNPTLSGSETVLTGLTIDGTNYRIPEVTVDETYVSDAFSNFLADEIEPKLEDKQDTLVSGTNIKTINGTSILGSGDLTIEGGSGSGTTVEANPTLDGTETVLTGITIDGESYSIPSGGSGDGTTVEANPADIATNVLNKLKVAGVTYSLPSGGSGEGGSLTPIYKEVNSNEGVLSVTFTAEEYTRLSSNLGTVVMLNFNGEVLPVTPTYWHVNMDTADESISSSFILAAHIEIEGMPVWYKFKPTEGDPLTFTLNTTDISNPYSGGGATTAINKILDVNTFSITFTAEEMTQLKSNTGIVVNAVVDGVVIPLTQVYTSVGGDDMTQEIMLCCGDIEAGLWYKFKPIADNPLSFQLDFADTSNPFNGIDVSELVTQEEFNEELGYKQSKLSSSDFKTINGHSVWGYGKIPFKTLSGQSLTGEGDLSVIEIVDTQPIGSEEEYRKHKFYLNAYTQKLGFFVKEKGGGSEKLNIQTCVTKLPYGLDAPAAAAVGDNIYIFGGQNKDDYQDTIMRFNIQSEKLTTLTVKMPWQVYAGAAVASGTNIYVFGGFGRSPEQQYNFSPTTVLKFDTLTETLTELDFGFSRSYYLNYGALVGDYIYIFGDCGFSDYGGVIGKLNTKTDKFTNINKQIKMDALDTNTGRNIPVAAVGTKIYLIGGPDEHGAIFDTTNNTVTELTTNMPVNSSRTCAASMGTNIYLFGGKNQNSIYKFNTKNNTMELLDIKCPRMVSSAPAVATGSEIYIVGGLLEYNDKSNTILRFATKEDIFTYKTIVTE